MKDLNLKGVLMQKENYRHGDVILKRVEKIPSGATKLETKGNLVLAEGENTGHSHKFPSGVGHLFKYDNRLYLEITSKQAKINHEEHGPGKVAPGCYEVLIQNEWQEDGWTKVID